MSHLRREKRTESLYCRLEQREVLTSFLPVSASVNAAGELVLQANPASEATQLDIRMNDAGEIGFSEVIGFGSNEFDPDDDPGVVFGDFNAFPDATSVRYIGNDFADTVIAQKSFSTIMNGNGGDDFLSGTRVYGGNGNDQLFGEFAFGNAGDDTIKGLFDRSNRLDGGLGNDTIYGSGFYADTIFGRQGNDTIYADIQGVDNVPNTDDTVFGGEGLPLSRQQPQSRVP